MLVAQHLLVEREPLVVERVAEPVALGAEVGLVVRVRHVLDRDLIGHGQPVTGQPGDLLRVVREDPDAREPEVDEDLRADPVVAQVSREAELEVGVDGVEALLLELVGAELVEQSDPPALLAQVQQHADALLLDHRQRRLQLLAAIAAQRVEHVTGQALRVHADEHIVLTVDVALDERNVVLVVDQRAVPDGHELAEPGRELGRDDPLDQLLVPAAVGDQIRDRDHLEAVALAVRLEVAHSRHRAVVVHDLADHPGRDQAGEPGEVDRRLGLTRRARAPRPAWP